MPIQINPRQSSESDDTVISPIPSLRLRDDRGRFIASPTLSELMTEPAPAEPVEIGNCDRCWETLYEGEEDAGWRECISCDDRMCLSCYDVYDGQCNDCAACDCGDCGECGYAEVEPDHSSFVRRWNWKPSAWRPKGEYPDAPLLGVELEVAGSYAQIVPAVRAVDDGERHFYMKEDGSINGVEIVTHPATLKWTKADGGWERVLDELNAADVRAYSGYGLHIHVSRNAFRHNGTRAKTHDLTWLKFMYDNAESLKVLSRRDWDNYNDARWCAFNRPGASELRAATTWVQGAYSERYLAINTNNERTYEMRFFRSTMALSELYAAMEFATASVEYARGIRARDVARGALEWGRFRAYVAEHADTYPNLLAEMSLLSDFWGSAAERDAGNRARLNRQYRSSLAYAIEERFAERQRAIHNRHRDALAAARQAEHQARMVLLTESWRDGGWPVRDDVLAAALDDAARHVGYDVISGCVCSSCNEGRRYFAQNQFGTSAHPTWATPQTVR